MRLLENIRFFTFLRGRLLFFIIMLICLICWPLLLWMSFFLVCEYKCNKLCKETDNCPWFLFRGLFNPLLQLTTFIFFWKKLSVFMILGDVIFIWIYLKGSRIAKSLKKKKLRGGLYTAHWELRGILQIYEN